MRGMVHWACWVENYEYLNPLGRSLPCRISCQLSELMRGKGFGLETIIVALNGTQSRSYVYAVYRSYINIYIYVYLRLQK